MADESERVTVTTYVPVEQREAWREDAEALDMSQSEFLRTMVQAGRRGFLLDGETENPVEPEVPGSDPRGNGVKSTVLEILREEGPLEWDQLFESVAGEIESDLDEAVTALMDDGRISHRPRTGEFSITGAEYGD